MTRDTHSRLNGIALTIVHLGALFAFWPALFQWSALAVAGVIAYITGVLGIVYFAYHAGTTIQPAQIEAVQWEATDEQRRETELQCLAENVYFEASGEPLAAASSSWRAAS